MHLYNSRIDGTHTTSIPIDNNWLLWCDACMIWFKDTVSNAYITTQLTTLPLPTASKQIILYIIAYALRSRIVCGCSLGSTDYRSFGAGDTRLIAIHSLTESEQKGKKANGKNDATRCPYYLLDVLRSESIAQHKPDIQSDIIQRKRNLQLQ